MTQEEKSILLKDLCARLSYDVIVQETFQNTQRDVPVWDCGPHYIRSNPEKVKPYLRPMSSMTEKEKKIMANLWKENNKLVFADPSEIRTYRFYDISVVDFLNSHHFDYRGLIEKGLALEAPEDMYSKIN